jgi:hypothetical protein
MLCSQQRIEESGLSYFRKGIEKTQLRRDDKATLLESVRAGRSVPAHGMTKDQAVTMLIQDIADYDEILSRLRKHDES